MANDRVQQLARRLREVQDEFEREVAAVGAPYWQKAPAEGEWSPAQIVAHMCESPGFYVGNITKMAAGGIPFLGRSEAEMAAGRERTAALSKADATHALSTLKECDAEVLRTVSNLTDDVLGNTGNHPRRGVISVEQQLESIFAHYDDHIRQLKAASAAQ